MATNWNWTSPMTLSGQSTGSPMTLTGQSTAPAAAPGVGTWALANSPDTQPNKNNAQNAIYNPATPIGNFLTGQAGPTTAYWATAQAAGNEYQQIGQQGQEMYNTGQAALTAAQAGQLTPAYQQQLDVQTAQITQAQQTATASIQSSFAAKGITDPGVLADATAIANSYYEQQKTTAYTGLIQQQQSTAMQQLGLGVQQQSAGAGGEANLNSTMLSDISGIRQQDSANSASVGNLIGGLIGSAASLAGDLYSDDDDDD